MLGLFVRGGSISSLTLTVKALAPEALGSMADGVAGDDGMLCLAVEAE